MKKVLGIAFGFVVTVVTLGVGAIAVLAYLCSDEEEEDLL